ncbi:Putative AC9 transposase, partial [Linum grandiflorum]
PIPSVASKSIFNSSGRLLDPHRSKLNSTTVEALMCTRSWIQDEEILAKGGKSKNCLILSIFSSIIPKFNYSFVV